MEEENSPFYLLNGSSHRDRNQLVKFFHLSSRAVIFHQVPDPVIDIEWTEEITEKTEVKTEEKEGMIEKTEVEKEEMIEKTEVGKEEEVELTEDDLFI